MSNDYLTPLGSTAAITANTTPLMGMINVYDATAGARTPTLPPLSGLRVGAQTGIEKRDSSVNAVTVSRSGSDVFDDGATSIALTTAGQMRLLEVVLVSGVKVWKRTTGYNTAVGGGGGGNVAVDTHAATLKATPVDADELPLVDSAALFTLKRFTWANLKAALASITAPFTVGSLEVGNASDTTITRMEAGLIGVEGVYIPTIVGAKRVEILTSPPGTPDPNTVYLVNDGGAPRVLYITSNAAPAINTDLYDAVSITNQALDFTSMSTNLSGTFRDCQPLNFRIKDNGTARAIPWGSLFSDGRATLPSTTVAGRTLSVDTEFDIVDGRFVCQAQGSRAAGTGSPPVFGTLGAILSGASGQTTANLPVPASVATGDIILATFFVDPYTVAMTPPAGFTEAPDSPANITTGQAVGLKVYWKRQTSATGAGETTGTYAFTMTSGFRGGRALRFTGCIGGVGVNPFDVTNSAAKTTTTDGTTPVVSDNTTGPNRLWVWTAIGFNGGGVATPPSGFTEQFDDGGQVLGTKTQVATGGSGSVTATFGSNGASAAWLGALLPA